MASFATGRNGGVSPLFRQQRPRRFINSGRKGEHILRPDRLFVRKKPGLGAKRFKQTPVRARFQLGEGVEYLATKAVRIVAELARPRSGFAATMPQ